MKMPKMPGGDMLKQLQEVMERAQNLETELKAERLEIASGGGAVKAVFNGLGELQEIKIDREVVDPNDVEMLEDLILGAVREGAAKAHELREQRAAEIQSQLPQVPGMPF
jgi:DNA-binding YbaB/EbfC family protein